MSSLRRAGRAAAAWLRLHGLALGVLLAVAAAPFATCVLRGETPFFLDISDHWYPFRLHAFEARQEGVLAHWCRHAFCGFPFLAQAEAALSYPPHWVLDLFHPAKTLLGQVIGHRFVLGALLYAVLVARGASRTAATLGGALLIASGVTMSCFTQIAVLRTLAWIPLVLLGAWRFSQGRYRAGLVWTALGTALPIVAGYPPFLQRAAVALPFLYVADPSWPRGLAAWRERGRRFLWAAGGAATGVAMGAAQVLPTMALTAVSQRQLGLDPLLLDGMRVEPLDALMLLAPRVATHIGIGRQGFAYLGVLPLALAALAVVRRCPGAAAFAVAAGAALVASMGRAVPVVGDLLASLPLVGSFRNPGQYLVAWVLVVPVLAAMGLDAWRARRPSWREAAGVLGGVAAALAVAALVPSAIDDRASLVRAAIGAAGLAAGALALALPPRLAPLVLVAACLCDAGTFLFNYPTRVEPDGRPRTRPVESLLVPDEPFAVVAERHADLHREGTPRAITSDVVFNWENHGWIAGVDDVRGLMALVPIRALDLNRIVAEGAIFERRPPEEPLYAYGPVHALDSPRIDLLAVRYAIGFVGRPGPGWTSIGDGVWERDAVPEARLAERVVVAGPFSPEGLVQDEWKALVAPGFDPRRDAVVRFPDAAGNVWATRDGPSPGSVRMAEVGVNGVRMEVEARRDAVLVWAETGDAGWTAEIDGARAAILQANWSQMAVVVPAGRHVVAWRYESPGWRLGLALSGLGLVLLLWQVVADARDRRPAT